MSVESDLAKAKQYRKDAGTLKNPSAKQDLLDAADRLEKRASSSAKKVARKRRKSGGGGRSSRVFDLR